MRSFFAPLILLVFLSTKVSSQQLFINEVSQGNQSKEYVEFVVAGNPTCQTPVPCMDLRGVVLDDNNGYFGAGSNMGIASGAVRFANTTFWSCIPQGTLIVIYNNSDVNPALPANDVSMNDGNCSLVIPINSNLLEGQSISTTTSITTYPASASWIAGAGNWGQVSMNNSFDSFLTTPNNNTTVPTHGVSWGDNMNNNIIYFAGSASNKVFYFANTVDNDPFEQANWIDGAVGVNETPGQPNNPQNEAWISGMNPDCGIGQSGIVVTIDASPTGCGTNCSGTATVSISGGQAPYTIEWSTTEITPTISDLCAGTYTVEVTDDGGCTASEQVTISGSVSDLDIELSTTNESCPADCDGAITATVNGGTLPYTYDWNNGADTPTISGLCPGNFSLTVTDDAGCTAIAASTVQAGTAPQNVSITTTGPFSTLDAPVQFNATVNGGVWTADCGTCISSTGVFNPQTLAPGVYEICYTIGSGNCASNDCQYITVTEDCVEQFTSEDVAVCPETIVEINGQQITEAGTYPFVLTDQNGCDSTHTLFLTHFTVNPEVNNYALCMGDSLELEGIWYFDNEFFSETTTDGNGCSVTNTTTITLQDCTIPFFNVFIPNTFTPNSDGVNDLFTINVEGGTLESGFVMNRWGEVVHEFDPNLMYWDGRTNQGLTVLDGVYTYLVKVRESHDGILNQYTGFITVIR